PHTEGSYMGRAGARTPMQWTNGINKGFSSASPEKLYRAVDTSFDASDVESQMKNNNSLLNKVKKLIALRRSEPALRASAEFVPSYTKSFQYPFAYIRAHNNNRLLIVLNPAQRHVSAQVILNYECEKPQLLAGKGELSLKGRTISLANGPVSYAIYRINSK
ncbi:MAG: glycosylase, partial [Bacteroidetes bacterium]|nr:glycosylase [Bacteroidota bacterium]